MSDRTDWLQWRRSGIGASDAPVVAGKAPWGSRLELWLDKKGRAPERPASEAMELGLLLEPAIAAMFEKKTGITLADEQVKLRSERYPFMLSTLDRLTTGGDIVELKAAGLWSGRELGDDGDSESLPEHWVIQAHHQMIVADRPKVTFAVLVPTLQVRIYTVERNWDLCRALVSIERDFWSMVESDTQPSDLQPQDAATLSSLYQGWHGTAILGDEDAYAATEYAVLGPEIKVLERRREVARARILSSMQDCAIGILPDGREVHRKMMPASESIVKRKPHPRITIKEPKL